VNYEGGQHFTDFSIPPYIQSMYDAQVHPGMYTLYNRMLDSLRRLGSELPMAFVLTGPWQSQFGSWGHIFDDDDAAPWNDRPKFQVLLDQIAQCVKTTSGTKNTDKTSFRELRSFPNPTTGAFRLDISEDWFGQNFQIRISDALGQVWLSQALTNNQFTLGEHWPNGLYSMEILDAGGRKVGVNRVVKIGSFD